MSETDISDQFWHPDISWSWIEVVSPITTHHHPNLMAYWGHSWCHVWCYLTPSVTHDDPEQEQWPFIPTIPTYLAWWALTDVSWSWSCQLPSPVMYWCHWCHWMTSEKMILGKWWDDQWISCSDVNWWHVLTSLDGDYWHQLKLKLSDRWHCCDGLNDVTVPITKSNLHMRLSPFIIRVPSLT